MKRFAITVFSITVVLIAANMFGPKATWEQINAEAPDHWSEVYISELYVNGILESADISRQPDEPVAREDFLRWLSRIAGEDVSETVVLRNGDAKLQDDTVAFTRIEAGQVLADLFNLPPAEDEILHRFTDYDNLPLEVRPVLARLATSGILRGRGPEPYQGKLDAYAGLTCAEAFAMLARCAGTIIASPGYHSDLLIRENAVINTGSVVLNNVYVPGRLTLAPGVGDGDIYLQGVTVEGRLTIKGGGANSIYIRDSIVGEISICRTDGAVHVITDEGTMCDVVYVDDGYDAVYMSGNYGHVIVNTDTPVFMEGTIAMATVRSENARIILSEASSVSQLIVTPEAGSTALQLDGMVERLEIAADFVNVTGTGQITLSDISGEMTDLRLSETTDPENIQTSDADTIKTSIASQETKRGTRAPTTKPNKPSGTVSGSGDDENNDDENQSGGSGNLPSGNGGNDNGNPPGGNGGNDNGNPPGGNGGNDNGNPSDGSGGNDNGNPSDGNGGNDNGNPPGGSEDDPPSIIISGDFDDILALPSIHEYTLVESDSGARLLENGGLYYTLPEDGLGSPFLSELFNCLRENDRISVGKDKIAEIVINHDLDTLDASALSSQTHTITLTYNGNRTLRLTQTGSGTDKLILSGSGNIAAKGINADTTLTLSNLAGLDISDAAGLVSLVLTGNTPVKLDAPGNGRRFMLVFANPDGIAGAEVDSVTISGTHDTGGLFVDNKNGFVNINNAAGAEITNISLDTGSQLLRDGRKMYLTNAGSSGKKASLLFDCKSELLLYLIDCRNLSLLINGPTSSQGFTLLTVIEKTSDAVDLHIETDNFYTVTGSPAIGGSPAVAAQQRQPHETGTYQWKNSRIYIDSYYEHGWALQP